MELVFSFADIANGLMAVPNLIGLIGLSPVVLAETRRFFKQFKRAAKLQPLTSVLPSMAGLRAQCRLLMQSRDPLTRRAGLFWGSWIADAGYLWGVNYMATKDADPVNRACAARLSDILR